MYNPLARIFSQLNRIEGELQKMKLDLTGLISAVNQQQTVDNSVLTLIQGMSAQLADLKSQVANGADNSAVQAQIQTLVDQLNTQQTQLVAAVSANTPSAPTDNSTTTISNPGPQPTPQA